MDSSEDEKIDTKLLKKAFEKQRRLPLKRESFLSIIDGCWLTFDKEKWVPSKM
jgi:hypothetical protein